MDIQKRIENFLHRSTYGICKAMGDQLGIAHSKIRLYFIYLSFITLGSPIIVYLVVAFWQNVRKYIRRHYSVLD